MFYIDSIMQQFWWMLLICTQLETRAPCIVTFPTRVQVESSVPKVPLQWCYGMLWMVLEMIYKHELRKWRMRVVVTEPLCPRYPDAWNEKQAYDKV